MPKKRSKLTIREATPQDTRHIVSMYNVYIREGAYELTPGKANRRIGRGLWEQWCEEERFLCLVYERGKRFDGFVTFFPYEEPPDTWQIRDWVTRFKTTGYHLALATLWLYDNKGGHTIISSLEFTKPEERQLYYDNEKTFPPSGTDGLVRWWSQNDYPRERVAAYLEDPDIPWSQA